MRYEYLSHENVSVTCVLIRQNEMYRFCKTKCDFFVQNEMC